MNPTSSYPPVQRVTRRTTREATSAAKSAAAAVAAAASAPTRAPVRSSGSYKAFKSNVVQQQQQRQPYSSSLRQSLDFSRGDEQNDVAHHTTTTSARIKQVMTRNEPGIDNYSTTRNMPKNDRHNSSSNHIPHANAAAAAAGAAAGAASHIPTMPLSPAIRHYFSRRLDDYHQYTSTIFQQGFSTIRSSSSSTTTSLPPLPLPSNFIGTISPWGCKLFVPDSLTVLS
jgi:hypothetical protein